MSLHHSTKSQNYITNRRDNMNHTKRIDTIFKATATEIEWAKEEYRKWEAEQDLAFGKDAWTVEIVDGEVTVVAK